MNVGRTLLFSLLPASWRDRYGAEVHDLLDASGWRLRDILDVVWLGLTLRTEALRRLSMIYYTIGLLLLGAGVAGGLWSAAELTNGISDIHEHWWSTAAFVGPAAAGSSLLLIGAAREQRRA
jgi:hypothetical protein